LLLALTVARSADKSPAKPFSRAQAAAIIANAGKIVSANGVDRLEKVRIGGIEQWISIRDMTINWIRQHLGKRRSLSSATPGGVIWVWSWPKITQSGCTRLLA
jgi:hypothetical protein